MLKTFERVHTVHCSVSRFMQTHKHREKEKQQMLKAQNVYILLRFGLLTDAPLK